MRNFTPFLALVLAGTWVLPGAARAETAPLDEARAAVARGDLATAAAGLEAALAATPDDQSLYRELSEIYDQKALAFDKALDLHRRYLERFPSGALAGIFSERQAVIERHRQVWPLLARYRQVLNTRDERDAEANLRAMEALLGEASGTSLAPDLLFWLAKELAGPGPLRHRERALAYADRYLASFPQNGRPAAEKAHGLVVRVGLLRAKGDVVAALASVRELEAIEPSEWQALKRALVTEVWTARAFQGCAAIFGLLCLAGLALRPWRRPGFLWQGKRLAVLAAGVLLVTLGPIAAPMEEDPGPRNTLLAMAGLGVSGLMALKLLSPLAGRIGRPAFLVLAVLLAASGIYMAHFLGGTLAAWEWPLEEWRS